MGAVERCALETSGSPSSHAPSNDELQRTSDGYAAGSPLNSVLGGRRLKRRPSSGVSASVVGVPIAAQHGLSGDDGS
jgi:hypothetical protein